MIFRLKKRHLTFKQASNSELAGYKQQDAHEYMQFMINALHATNPRPHPDGCRCVMHQMFYGKLQSIVTCDKCNNKTVTRDPFLDLSLEVRSQTKKKAGNDVKNSNEPSIMRLEDCLKRFTGREKLPAADYTCSKCEAQRDATKQFSILQLPPVLCVHLKVS